MTIPGHIMGFSPGGVGDVWPARVFKETDLQPSHGGCRVPWASALSQEPRGGLGRLKVTQ